MAPGLGGLCFTAKVVNVLKKNKFTGKGRKPYSFDLNTVIG